MKKAQATSKSCNRLKKDVREKEKDLHKMRKDMIDLKSQNDTLHSFVKELKQNSARQNTNRPTVAAQAPRVSSARTESLQAQVNH